MQINHEDQINRLNRIEGQVRGIRKMIEDGRYCVDVAIQIKAARAGLKRVGLSVLDHHLRTCVSNAIRSANAEETETKIREVLSLVQSWD